MKIEKNLEKLVLEFYFKTEIDIAITDIEKIIYYMGDTQKCVDYLYQEVSSELKSFFQTNKKNNLLTNEQVIPIIKNGSKDFACQMIYHVELINKLILFNKKEGLFSKEETSYIQSFMYLIEKFFKE